jgi:hypothetical protein
MMFLAKWMGCLLLTFGAFTVLAAQGEKKPPLPAPTPGGIVRIETNPGIPVRQGEPTAAKAQDWHCEKPLFDLTSPTAAYKTLYFAVKCKNTATIKKVLSAETTKFITGTAAMQKKPFDEAIQNGLTESTFSPTLPQMCQARIKDKFGAVEVNGTGKWEDLPFVLEDGEWKLAIGDIFGGSYQTPGETKCSPKMQMPPPQPGPSIPPPSTKGGPTKP